MNRKEILDKAEKMINGPRAKDYGDAHENHERIAKMWSVLLEREVTVAQVYRTTVRQSYVTCGTRVTDSLPDQTVHTLAL